jgi:hypothetical protein
MNFAHMLALQNPRRRLALIGTAIAVCWFIAPVSSYAQANRGSTTSGMFGSTTLGSTKGASPQGLGQGMTTGMASNATQSGSGQGGITNMSSQMVQGGGPVVLQAGGSTGFVGQSSTNNAAVFNASGQGGMGNQNFNVLRQLATNQRQNQFNAQQAQKASRVTTQAQAQFRVPLRLGFQPTVAANAPLPKVQSSIAKVPGLTKLGPIEATLEGTTAVLRGRVATEADRQLAEGLARLEPGVGAVRNELVVGSAAASTATLPAPAGSTP